MTERIDIANQALTWLGEDIITSLDDDLNRARVLKTNYENIRDAVLEAHEWSFAMKRWRPSPSTTAPVFGPNHAFPIPKDVLRVTGVYRDEYFSVTHEKEQVQWLVERNEIICDEEVIYCRGIQRIEQEGRFSPLFVKAFAAHLAAVCAVAITASDQLQANMFGFYQNFINEAKSRDGLQGRSRRIRNRTLLKAR